MEDLFLNSVPAWIKYLAAFAGGSGAALLYLRQWLSQAKVDRTANEANVETIQRLMGQLEAERRRADAYMREREEMVREIGALKGKVEILTEQVETLTALVKELRGRVP